jgi:hypothetical protein
MTDKETAEYAAAYDASTTANRNTFYHSNDGKISIFKNSITVVTNVVSVTGTADVCVQREDGTNMTVRNGNGSDTVVSSHDGWNWGTVGGRWDAAVGRSLKGWIGELYVIPRALSDGEIALVTDHLKSKWGIS